MSILLVTYDLNQEVKRPNLLASIKALGSWAKLSESSYAVNTYMTPQQVYNNLAGHLDNDDQLYVIHLSPPWVGYGPKEVNSWLNENLAFVAA